MLKCDYGCDQPATHTFKSGKNCCSRSINSCPAMKEKNSEAMKKLRGEVGDRFWKNGHPKAMLGKDAWNKGLTKESDSRIMKQSEKVKGRILSVTGGKGSTPEKESERIRKISEKAKLKNGGYREKSGRGKKGRYNGFWCDSSWELAYVIYNLEHNIHFTRNEEKFKYVFKEKTFNYLPDFVENDEFVEIKGYNTRQWEAKLEQFPKKLRILYESDMKKYLDYVVEKHGKDFVKLYE